MCGTCPPTVGAVAGVEVPAERGEVRLRRAAARVSVVLDAVLFGVGRGDRVGGLPERFHGLVVQQSLEWSQPGARVAPAEVQLHPALRFRVIRLVAVRVENVREVLRDLADLAGVAFPGGVHEQLFGGCPHVGGEGLRPGLDGLGDDGDVAFPDRAVVHGRSDVREGGGELSAGDRFTSEQHLRGADAGGGVAAADPQGVAEQHAGGGDGQLVGEAGVVDFAGEPDCAAYTVRAMVSRSRPASRSSVCDSCHNCASRSARTPDNTAAAVASAACRVLIGPSSIDTTLQPGTDNPAREDRPSNGSCVTDR